MLQNFLGTFDSLIVVLMTVLCVNDGKFIGTPEKNTWVWKC